MILGLGVILVALATLFSLTALALSAIGALHHPLRVVALLAAMLALGLVLLLQ